MDTPTVQIVESIPAWKTVLDVAASAPQGSWILVGGLMTQAHAALCGRTSRATKDVDVLVDLIAHPSNVSGVMQSLRRLGFEPQEPGLRGSPFHRTVKDGMIVDVLVADHLPSGRKQHARVNRWPMMETPGGAQAIERRMKVVLASESRQAVIEMPNLLGAIVLKTAAWMTDGKDRHRHLEDVALLASLASDHATMLESIHGSDRSRIRSAAEALASPNEPAWLLLPEDMRVAGRLTLRILSS
ncbi:hypothetical protein [Arabiibacter massiliensis]|uniref:hypothetical protein n=1 Tax=Arabiibacter massiliensis TaxID=1870985 RepID=UPI00117AACD1|nr:hypothetical protein [Arabiibacter massiliensis]